MNQTYVPRHPQPAALESIGQDPLHAVAGLLWGSLLGTAIWLAALSIVLNG